MCSSSCSRRSPLIPGRRSSVSGEASTEEIPNHVSLPCKGEAFGQQEIRPQHDP